jgi:drug/metabolite transporter (DMT)-like permease
VYYSLFYASKSSYFTTILTTTKIDMHSGNLLIITAAIGFGLNPMLAQLLMGDGLSPLLVTLYRFLLPALVLVPWLRLQREEYTEGLIMFAFGMANGLAMLAYFSALSQIPVAQAIFIYYSYPVISLLVGWGLYGKQPTTNRIISAGLIIIAASLVFQPQQPLATQESSQWLATLACFLAPLVFAITIHYWSQPRKPLAPLQRMRCGLLGHMVVLVPLAIISQPMIWLPQSNAGYVWIIALAGLATSLPQLLFTLGAPKVGAEKTSIAGALELVVALMCGTVVLGNDLNHSQIVAMILILMAMQIRHPHQLRPAVT